MNTNEVVRRRAVYGLPGVDDTPIVADSLDAVLSKADAAHVLPHVRLAVRAGWLANPTDGFIERLERRTRETVAQTLSTYAALIDAVDALAAVGVQPVVLKGIATGHLDYPVPHVRYSTDADLYVPGRQREVLVAAGIGTVPIPRSVRWQERYSKTTTVVDPHGTEIDVHHRLAEGYPGISIPMDEAMAHTESFVLGGVEMRGLDGPGRLIHAAIHATSPDDVKLHSLRDVAQVVLATGADWREAVDRAQRWRVDATFAAGVVHAWMALGLEPHPLTEWAAAYRPQGRQRAARVLHKRVWGGEFLSGSLALAPWQWPGYLFPLAFPSRAYLRAEGTSWRRRASSLINHLRRPRRSA